MREGDAIQTIPSSQRQLGKLYTRMATGGLSPPDNRRVSFRCRTAKQRASQDQNRTQFPRWMQILADRVDCDIGMAADELVTSNDPLHPANLICELCRLFYGMSWHFPFGLRIRQWLGHWHRWGNDDSTRVHTVISSMLMSGIISTSPQAGSRKRSHETPPCADDSG